MGLTLGQAANLLLNLFHVQIRKLIDIFDLVQIRKLLDTHLNIVNKLSSSIHRASYKAVSNRRCVAKAFTPVHDTIGIEL